MDRSTRNLSIITLVVLAIFIAVGHVIKRSELSDWWTVLLFLALALGIWFYDRVSHRGVDDSEADDTVIEPLVYDHQGVPISIPDTIELVAPNPGTVIKSVHPHVPVVDATVPPAAAPVIESAAPQAPTSVTEPVESQPAPMPPRPRPDVDNPSRGSEEAVGAQAAAKMTSTASDAIATDKSEPAAPAPDAEQHPPATAVQTTTIEEKAAPIPSSPAPETHPDLAAKAPEAANVPSVPVSSEKAGQPVPTSVSGSAPEPATGPAAKAPADTPIVPPKTASELGNPYAKELGSESSIESVLPIEPPSKKRAKDKNKVETQGSPTNAPVTQVEPAVTAPGGKVQPANADVEVSASAAAAAAPNEHDPNLPMHATTDQPDDLKIIEGIGPKMEKALQAAGINTFAMLAGTSEAHLREAISAAGMRFAPSMPTWAEQASYAANGDFVGLEAFQKTLLSGRKGK
ncbi:MAG: hypothetical protein ABI970_18475 [Chloroflexota bacterium]